MRVCDKGGKGMSYTILVCDDDKTIVNGIALHLQKEGYKVIKARCHDAQVRWTIYHTSH